MTPQEAIKCEKCLHQSVCEKKTCAECQGSGCGECELYDLYNGVPYIEDCEDFIDADLINRQQAEIKTLQERNVVLRGMIDTQKAEIERLKTFKSYFDSLYGTGLEIANWHLNGDLKPFDNFYDSAIEEMVGDSN